MDEEFLQKNDEDETTLQNTVALGPPIKEHDFIVVTIENKQYVAKVWHIEDVKATSKFMRRDFSNEDSRVMKFRYPWIDDIYEISILNEGVLGTFLDYTISRRGGFIVNACIKQVFKNLN